MDPPASFKIPLLLRKRKVVELLSNRISDRLTSSFAFKSSENKERDWHEISPRLSMRLNAGYRMENRIARSEMKREYPNHFNSGDNSLDQTFFKKKDEMVTYTESFFKNKILYSKK